MTDDEERGAMNVRTRARSTRIAALPRRVRDALSRDLFIYEPSSDQHHPVFAGIKFQREFDGNENMT